MSSENAKAVAHEVVKSLRKSTKVNMGKIIREKGYSDSVSKHPDQVVNTKSYQDEIRPLVDKLESERNAIIERLTVTRSKASYRDLMDGLDKVTKNLQLIQGKSTANISLPIPILNALSDNDSDKENSEVEEKD